MTPLELLKRWLESERARLLQISHSQLMAATTDLTGAKYTAHEADTVARILDAVRQLDRDAAKFAEVYLKEMQGDESE